MKLTILACEGPFLQGTCGLKGKVIEECWELITGVLEEVGMRDMVSVGVDQC